MNSGRKRIAIIPARGGSKSISKKNLQIVGSRSLVSRAIDSAISSEIFDEICVSTDNLEIVDEARKCGLDVPFLRPKELSEDWTLGKEVIKHAISHYHQRGMDFDSITLLQPTSPFRTAEDIRFSHEIFESEPFESLISVLDVTNFDLSTLYSVENPTKNYEFMTLQPLGILSKSKVAGTLRQDFPRQFWRNGAIYILKPMNLFSKLELLPSPIGAFEMSWIKSINIDEPKDLDLARLIAQKFGV